jgi:hypothetical protein
MTISKGSSWGDISDLTAEQYWAMPTIGELALDREWSADQPVNVRNTNATIARYLGLTADLSQRPIQVYRWDLGVVSWQDDLGPQQRPFLAHVVQGRPLHGCGWAALNVDLPTPHSLVPKTHPNDGRMHLVEWRLNAWDNISRVVNRVDYASMTHNSPKVIVGNLKELSVQMGKQRWLHIDAETHGAQGQVKIRLIADALNLYV